MATKEELYRLVDDLPESELHVALRFLEYLRDLGGDPLLHSLMQASEDDEPDTLEEQQASDKAWQEYLRGEARPWEEVREELASEG